MRVTPPVLIEISRLASADLHDLQKMKFVLIPKSISWVSIFLSALVSIVLIGIGFPSGCGAECAWLLLSSLTLFGGLTFLSAYEKIRGREMKAAIFSILNTTLILWWPPLSFLAWRAALKL